jgi:SAM-dependent methyltransferase
MSNFDAAWLDLREPTDRQARSATLIDEIARHFQGRSQITVVDLGCGTGGTMRALAPHLPRQQHWHLVDIDARLLAAVAARNHGALPATIEWRTQQADLLRELETVMAQPADLVTLSALLDLVSIEWMERLADLVAAAGRPIYAPLTYNGRNACEPTDPFDRAVMTAFNAHQRGDKGFGRAMGSMAAARTTERLAARQFNVRLGDSDWQLGDGDATLQAAVLRGWHEAAVEHDVLGRQELDAWLQRRLEHLHGGHARLTIGHRDIWAWPAAI